MHGSPVAYKNPDHGIMLFVQGERGTVQGAFEFSLPISV